MAGVTPYTENSWKKTNADRIRHSSDEELAEFIAFHDMCPEGWQIEDARCKQSKGCDECWLEWLRQEVNDDP